MKILQIWEHWCFEPFPCRKGFAKNKLTSGVGNMTKVYLPVGCTLGLTIKKTVLRHDVAESSSTEQNTKCSLQEHRFLQNFFKGKIHTNNESISASKWSLFKWEIPGKFVLFYFFLQYQIKLKLLRKYFSALRCFVLFLLNFCRVVYCMQCTYTHYPVCTYSSLLGQN